MKMSYFSRWIFLLIMCFLFNCTFPVSPAPGARPASWSYFPPCTFSFILFLFVSSFLLKKNSAKFVIAFICNSKPECLLAPIWALKDKFCHKVFWSWFVNQKLCHEQNKTKSDIRICSYLFLPFSREYHSKQTMENAVWDGVKMIEQDTCIYVYSWKSQNSGILLYINVLGIRGMCNTFTLWFPCTFFLFYTMH